MKDALLPDSVKISLLDADYLLVELDLTQGDIKLSWLRPVIGSEIEHGLGIAVSMALELKHELKKTHSLLCKQGR
ncbi:hypothetical protein ACSX1A_11120 [Pontibacter sp. MBLB2868]|uniref:hypothetical protein n=1 Tax=Pontibacter sp. MBLB2868 TaxID=3451555 RepID=UPI003F7556AA